MNRPCRIFLLVSLALLSGSCAVLKPRFASSSDAPSPTEKYVPEGKVLTVDYPTSVQGPSKRKTLVYLPAGYDASADERYPVLYMLHGAKGTELSWVIDGNLLRNVDSLVNTGDLRKCIVVMPNMNYYKDDEDYGDSRFKAAIESFFEVDGAVETGFVKDVVMTTDSLFRTIPEKGGRAIAGLSIGGLQAINISASYPDEFSYIGLFSPLSKSVIQKSDYSNFFKKLKQRQVAQFADPPELYDIYIGKGDIFYPQICSYCRYLSKNGYEYEFSPSKGGHDWYNWIPYSISFMKKLWK